MTEEEKKDFRNRVDDPIFRLQSEILIIKTLLAVAFVEIAKHSSMGEDKALKRIADRFNHVKTILARMVEMESSVSRTERMALEFTAGEYIDNVLKQIEKRLENADDESPLIGFGHP